METTNQIRDINQLNCLVKTQLELAIADLRQQGVTPLVVETLRTTERQKWLYGQGRTKAECRAKGVPEKYARSGNKVTSTLNSIHITGCAVDVVPLRDGKAIWNAKDKDTKKIIATMTKYGFEAGANWSSFVDSPHFQIKKINKDSKVYSKNNTNTFVAKAIQMALNKTLKLDLKVDGEWGANTTKAVNMFRASFGYEASGSVGITILKKLFIGEGEKR